MEDTNQNAKTKNSKDQGEDIALAASLDIFPTTEHLLLKPLGLGIFSFCLFVLMRFFLNLVPFMFGGAGDGSQF